MTMRRDMELRVTLNGSLRQAVVDSRSLLVEFIRELGATGTRIGCLTGDCGACTIIVDGRPVKSCLVLAVSAGGSCITTIEGCDDHIAASLKEGFIAEKGFQCGYCTSGMIMVALDFLASNSNPTETEIRQAISGNLCRCTGYDDIVNAIASAAA